MIAQHLEPRVEHQCLQRPDAGMGEVDVQALHRIVESADAQLGVEAIEQDSAAAEGVALDRQEIGGAPHGRERGFLPAESSQHQPLRG